MPYYFTVSDTMHDFYLEMEELVELHRDEIDLWSTPLDIDKETYAHLEESGNFIMFEMRAYSDKGSKLVGYCGFHLYNNLHHKTSLHAKQDVIFLHKQYRGHGLRFIDYCEKVLKESGVNHILHCVPTCNNWSKILTRRGYKELETIYSKELN